MGFWNCRTWPDFDHYSCLWTTSCQTSAKIPKISWHNELLRWLEFTMVCKLQVWLTVNKLQCFEKTIQRSLHSFENSFWNRNFITEHVSNAAQYVLLYRINKIALHSLIFGIFQKFKIAQCSISKHFLLWYVLDTKYMKIYEKLKLHHKNKTNKTTPYQQRKSFVKPVFRDILQRGCVTNLMFIG